MDTLHQHEHDCEQNLLNLDEFARAGARRLLTQALEAEVQEYIEAAKGERDERGRALVVRNDHAREREILLGAGSVAVKAQRVNDRRVDESGNRRRFKSVILPQYLHKSPKVAEVLPLLYLHHGARNAQKSSRNPKISGTTLPFGSCETSQRSSGTT